jgi:pimeloyl-ACP methyl ester carboxylesterase
MSVAPDDAGNERMRATTQALSDALQVIYREATRSPWICLNALKDSDPPPPAPMGTDASPVLILGGFLSHPYYYAPFGRILAQHGYAVHYDEIFNAQPFKPHVIALSERVQRLAYEAGSPIRVIGHSLGGLQATALLLECPDAIAQVVTVASPIAGGTPWRPLQRLAERVLDVRGSDTEMLRAGIEPFAPRITTISSPQDLVAPPSVCTVRGASNVVLSTVPRRDEALASHIGVIFMQTVVRIVLASLRRPGTGEGLQRAV